MKAVILAGGKGTRGKPYTDFFPKAMIPINGKPLIHYIIDYIGSFKFIDEILIVSDFKGLGGQIQNYLENIAFRKKVTFVQDSQSGTAGDLIHVSKKLGGTSEFLLWFVDNLCVVDLKKMLQKFKEKKSLVCIATRNTRKEETGFAIVKDGIIKEFREKPIINLQMSECLGIYILDVKILSKIRTNKTNNLSYDVLQKLAKNDKISSFDVGKK
ncbi:MAG: nucleotidyltransferase family protein, partial [Nitrosopumilaceae archaeon]